MPGGANSVERQICALIVFEEVAAPVVTGCSSNTITWDSATPDATFTILSSSAISVSAPTPQQTNTAECTLGSTTLEVRDSVTGEWSDYATMASKPAWITNFDAASLSFDIDTSDTSLATQVHALRYAVSDDGTPVTSGYDIFTVTFDYICHVDTLNMQTASGNSDLDCTFGASCSVSTAFDSPSHSETSCPLNVGLEVFLDSISDWIPYDDPRNTLAPAISAYSSTDGSFTVDSSGMSSVDIANLSPSTSWNMKQTYTSSDSLDSDGTFIDYYSITLRNDCSDGVLSKTAEITDVVYEDDDPAATASPTYTYTRDPADCPLTATLSILDEATNVWIVFDSSAGNPDHTWVSAFTDSSSSSGTTAGETQIQLTDASAFKPQTAFKAKVEVKNENGSDPSPIIYEFDITVVDFCIDSQISFGTSQAAVTYEMQKSPVTPAETVTFEAVTTTTDLTRCPVSRKL